LKAENFELKQKERDYNILKSQLMDLERRFKVLQEEKHRIQQSSKNRGSLSLKKTASSMTEMKRAEDVLVSRERDLKELKEEINTCNTALDKRDAEIKRLRKEQAAYEENIEKLLHEKKLLEDDIGNIEQEYINAKKKAESLIIENEHISNERIVARNRVRNVEEELMLMRKKLEDEELRLEVAKRDNMQREKELTAILSSRAYNNEELNRINVINIRLENDNREIAQRIADVEVQLAKTRKHCDDGSILLNSREKELKQLQSDLRFLEDRNLVTVGGIRKAREESETLQRLLEKHKDDIDFQKRLCDIEAAKKVELQLEKRKLQSEALSKDIEMRHTKKELEQVRGSHEYLLENKDQIRDELNALKQHAEVLENQNLSLNNELESFVDIDQRVRQELDRKPRVDYLKTKNNTELQQSFIKVRESISPRRSTHKTDYTSPYRSPLNY